MAGRILLVDDEKDFGELTSTMLEFHDFAVTSFDDPLDAIAAVKTNPFDLIVSDLMMPHIDGFELIKQVREVPNYLDVPIIVLTAKTLTENERKFLKQNNAHVLIKPFEPQGLIEQIKGLLP